MKEEIWKTIKDYEGFYEISNLGNVRSLDRMVNAVLKIHGRLIKSHTNKNNGHLQVMLHKQGRYKMMYIKRLVAEAFLENPNGYKNVKHLDGNKENNTVENIFWSKK